VQGAGCGVRRARWSLVGKQIVNRHRPARERRLGVGTITPMKANRNTGIAGPIGANNLIPQLVDVPGDERPGREIVGALVGHRVFSRRSKVVGTPHFDGKYGCAGDEAVGHRLRGKRGVRTERAPVRKIDNEADIVG